MSSMSFYVYEIWDPIKKEPFYVGKGKGKRYKYHLKEATGIIDKRTNSHKTNRIKKIIRLGSFPETKIVFRTDDENEAFSKEKELIKLYGRRDLGTGCLTNLTEGGDGVSGHKVSIETRLLQSELSRGSNNNMYGKKHSKEAIRIMKEKRRARKFIYHHTEEWKEYLRKNNPGRITSKPICQFNIEGNLVNYWSSCNKAAKALNCNRTNILKSIGKHHISYGYYWRHPNDPFIKDNFLTNVQDLNQKRLKNHHERKVIQMDLKGKIIKIWKSQLELKRALGLNNPTISNILTGKRKNSVYYGFSWKAE